MEQLRVRIEVNSDLYSKDPNSSDLGRNILSEGMRLIVELGFESFTFKKLGQAIGSNESSVYRYFENKHQFLLYLLNWYWNYMEYRLVFLTANVADPLKNLTNAIELISQPIRGEVESLNLEILEQIMVSESGKVYHTKDVDNENKKGYYKSYKRVVGRLSDMVTEINPDFKYPHMLISTVIEGAIHQRYFSEHLPSLTDIQDDLSCLSDFYVTLVLNTIKPQHHGE